MERINEAIRFLRTISPGATDSVRNAYQLHLIDMVDQCNKVKNEMNRLRGLGESETSIHHNHSNMYIQALEKVIAAQKKLEMLEMGTIEELTRQKIKILEDQCKF